jgi:hypothetical protein
MNYYTQNKEVLKAMEDIFGQKFASSSRVNFSISYSQHRKMSMALVQIEGGGFHHALILVFTMSLTLYDVVKYYKSYVRKYGIMSKYSPPVNVIKKFIFKNIPPYNPLTVRKLREDNADDKINFKIENLKNQIEQLKNKNRSYRDEISNLKDRIQLLNKKNRSSI